MTHPTHKIRSSMSSHFDFICEYCSRTDGLGADRLIDPCPLAVTMPVEMTPAIKDVLGMPNFQCGPLAHSYRHAGFDIRERSEDEQAFILWRFLRLAIQHPDNWRDIIGEELKAIARGRKVKVIP